MGKQRNAGSPDSDFGNEGQVRFHVDGMGHGESFVLRDGKILSVSIRSEPNTAILVRHLADGALDDEFGTGGVVQTSLGVGGTFRGSAQTVLEDGKILIGGHFETSGHQYVCHIRLMPDGQLDGSFGLGGRSVVDLPNTPMDEAERAIVQPDGKVAALARSVWGFDRFDTVLFRLNADGSHDKAFGSDGYSYEFPSGSYMWGLQVLHDGKFLIDGARGDEGMLVRCDRMGFPDTSFGQDGHFFVRIPGHPVVVQVYSAAVQADGKIVVAGPAGSMPQVSWIARLEADGSGFDRTFNKGEPLVLSMGDAGNIEDTVIVLDDGKILSLGRTFGSGPVTTLRRFLPDGTPDMDFGTNGVVLIDPGASIHLLSRLEVQPDGKYVVSGAVLDLSIGWFGAIFRFLPA